MFIRFHTTYFSTTNLKLDVTIHFGHYIFKYFTFFREHILKWVETLQYEIFYEVTFVLDNDIDLPTLLTLSDDEIKELINSVGIRRQFLNKLEQFKRLQKVCIIMNVGISSLIEVIFRLLISLYYLRK